MDAHEAWLCEQPVDVLQAQAMEYDINVTGITEKRELVRHILRAQSREAAPQPSSPSLRGSRPATSRSQSDEQMAADERLARQLQAEEEATAQQFAARSNSLLTLLGNGGPVGPRLETLMSRAAPAGATAARPGSQPLTPENLARVLSLIRRMRTEPDGVTGPAGAIAGGAGAGGPGLATGAAAGGGGVGSATGGGAGPGSGGPAGAGSTAGGANGSVPGNAAPDGRSQAPPFVSDFDAFLGMLSQGALHPRRSSPGSEGGISGRDGIRATAPPAAASGAGAGAAGVGGGAGAVGAGGPSVPPMQPPPGPPSMAPPGGVIAGNADAQSMIQALFGQEFVGNEGRPGSVQNLTGAHVLAALIAGLVPHQGIDSQVVEARTVTTTLNEDAAGSGDADNKQCMVCLEGFKAGEEVRILPCLHRYHRGCVDTWLAQNRHCPVCKHDVTR